MKISRTTLHRIIKEEVTSLVEAPVSRTVNMAQQARRKKRDQARQTEKDFFGTDVGLTGPDTKTIEPRSAPKKPKDPGAQDPWGLQQIKARRAAAAAARGSTVAMDAPDEEEDPDKTVPPTTGPSDRDARDEKEREVAGAKQASQRHLSDPKRISITNLDSDVRDKILTAYEHEASILIDDTPLGAGRYGIVYPGENSEYGPVAVKLTLEGQEVNAYKNIKTLKDGLASRDPQAASVLPTILDIRTLASPPVVIRPGTKGRGANYIEQEGGQTYKVFVIQMELLKKVPTDIQSDVFGARSTVGLGAGDVDPIEKRLSGDAAERAAADPEYVIKNADVPDRVRAIKEYLTIQNIYVALEKIFGKERWETLLAAIQDDPGPVNEGPRGALPIQDKRAFPPFREIEKLLPALQKQYLASKAGSDGHRTSLQKIHGELANKVSHIFRKYVKDDTLAGQVEAASGLMLPQQMAANVQLPQYDPETIEADAALSSEMMPPGELQTKVGKNLYNRLKKLEKYNARYGDVHQDNLMMRADGELVVADVGLFLFARGGEDYGYAGHIAERLMKLAGLI